jgi:N-acetylmuramoyl-L-alanine amidase
LKRIVPRLRAVARITLYLAMIPLALPAQRAAASTALSGWQVAKIDGRDYISSDSIQHFYRFAAAQRSGMSVTLQNPKVVMKLTIGSHECLMNGMKFIFSHPVLESGGKAHVSRIDLTKLIDPVLRPNFIRNAEKFQTVILDPGHGGKDPGARNALGTEARYNLLLAEKTRSLLTTKGFKVVMTRENDRFLSLQERVDLANAVRQNAIFLSIHFNSGGRQARGIETFTLSPPGISHYGRNPTRSIAASSEPASTSSPACATRPSCWKAALCLTRTKHASSTTKNTRTHWRMASSMPFSNIALP